MTVEEKANLIIKDIKSQTGTDPCVMFRNMVKNEYINMHGPEHHILELGEITCNLQQAQ